MSPYFHEGDYLVVDRALNPKHNDIVIAVIERELTVKRPYQQPGRVMLSADNASYPPIRILGEMQLQIWEWCAVSFAKQSRPQLLSI